MKLYVKVFLKTPNGNHEARTQAIKADKGELVAWNERIVFADTLLGPGSVL